MKRTSMTRDEQERWAVEYLAANLAREEIEDAENSITVQAFADFFRAQWPKTFNRMHFAAMVRRQAQQAVPQGIGSTAKQQQEERSVKLMDKMFTLPQFGHDHIR